MKLLKPRGILIIYAPSIKEWEERERQST